jgi:fluoroquinolone resistance protein
VADRPLALASVLDASPVLDEVLSGALPPGTEVRDLDLEACRIEGATLEQSVWRRCSLDACTFTGVNLSRATLIDVRLSDCTMRDSKAQGVGWAGVRQGGLARRSISFERCRLDYGSFAGGDLRGMRFVGCSLVDADFSDADVREVEMVGCDLSGARFSGADLRGAVVVGASGLSLDLRDTRTLGMRVDPGTALALVQAAGLRIVDGVTECDGV